MIRNILMATAAITMMAGAAQAEGELNIYNWGNYTSPDVVKKFEEKYKVKVTITDYDSNDTALAKVRAGGHGFDMVVPSGNFMPIWIKEGLLLEARPDQMENFKNVDPQWVNVEYDPGRHYSVPWQWGTVGVSVRTDKYKGDINTWGILFDTPAELKGKVNVVPEMTDVVDAALAYTGGKRCTTDKEALKKARDVLVAAKPNWVAMEYSTIEKMVKGDYLATSDWNGSALRQRLQNPDIKYGYPKEGFTFWMDNLSILKDAKNAENAKLFMNFVMDPENAAGLSAFARYANGIAGSDKFMPADMKDAPELNVPADAQPHGQFALACPPEAVEMYTKIWTDLMK
ncbi:MAG TPA: extracellular solute-binding protein [Aestuariivirga sp.]|jgi:spermidine/putrescine transport system substrate-binding protein|nr:extracellular solute-binding protein [Aestuariivirga sp.]